MSINKNLKDNKFINENIFDEKAKDQSLKIIKWKELPLDVIYKIIKVLEIDGKFGKSNIITLMDREGEISKVWACSGLNRENEPLEGSFVKSTGFKVSQKTKQEYLSYYLVRQ